MDTIRAIKGTQDILPVDVALWQQMEVVAQRILTLAGYREIRTPIFERTELFVRSIGTATDVVSKEMYSFTTQGNDDITLRPEATAGVVRAFIQNNLYASGDVQKLWYCGPMFRYERPQKGRQRQFHQLGLEALGSSDPRADVETIAIAIDILKTLGLGNLSVTINSVGRGDDRDRYRQALIDYLTPYRAELDKDSRDRLSRNPLRVLDSKDERTREIVAEAPKLVEYLSDTSKAHFDRVLSLLDNLDIAYAIDHKLVRGLDYYTHTAFEIQSNHLGAQNAVCGGGRYDGLVSELGGPETPAVGWAMGLERIAILLQQQQFVCPTQTDVYVISRGQVAEDVALAIAQQLRQAGLVTALDLSGGKFNKQFKRADRSGATWALVLGDEEVARHVVQAKQLQTGKQYEVTRTDLVAVLRGDLVPAG
ncbi:histidine--tRNA ligase [Synechococcus sp. PCC 7336]|uniref:histidine--tRNA ligase n=1 Tax=Synechococcus sp. PCC 7336 TaxID=195250 RepID=UPI000348E505|nr:histidine--tRNA ligase [Synechococcus sp. PCC 7336]